MKNLESANFVAGILSEISNLFQNYGLEPDERDLGKFRYWIETKLIEMDVTNPELVESLKQWRSERAAKDNVKPYFILNNKTLISIANAMPATEQELKAVSGIGEGKIYNYGREILEVIARNLEEI